MTKYMTVEIKGWERKRFVIESVGGTVSSEEKTSIRVRIPEDYPLPTQEESVSIFKSGGAVTVVWEVSGIVLMCYERQMGDGKKRYEASHIICPAWEENGRDFPNTFVRVFGNVDRPVTGVNTVRPPGAPATDFNVTITRDNK